MISLRKVGVLREGVYAVRAVASNANRRRLRCQFWAGPWGVIQTDDMVSRRPSRTA